VPAKRTESKTSKAPAARKPAVRRKRGPRISPKVSHGDIAMRSKAVTIRSRTGCARSASWPVGAW